MSLLNKQRVHVRRSRLRVVLSCVIVALSLVVLCNMTSVYIVTMTVAQRQQRDLQTALTMRNVIEECVRTNKPLVCTSQMRTLYAALNDANKETVAIVFALEELLDYVALGDSANNREYLVSKAGVFDETYNPALFSVVSDPRGERFAAYLRKQLDTAIESVQ